MAGYEMKWEGPKVFDKIRSTMIDRLNRAAYRVAGYAKEKMSRRQPLLKRKGKLPVGLDPSKPGEFPKIVTGHLWRNVIAKPARRSFGGYGMGGEVWEASWGTNVPYGRHLAFGTRHMAARPWMRRTIEETRAIVETTIQGKI